MKLGGSIGNVIKKLKEACFKNSIYVGLLVHLYTQYQYKLYSLKWTKSLKYIEFL
jgi:hypothetical protein